MCPERHCKLEAQPDTWALMVGVIDYLPGSSTAINPQGKGKCQGGESLVLLPHLKHTTITVDNIAPTLHMEKKEMHQRSHCWEVWPGNYSSIQLILTQGLLRVSLGAGVQGWANQIEFLLRRLLLERQINIIWIVPEIHFFFFFALMGIYQVTQRKSQLGEMVAFLRQRLQWYNNMLDLD